MRRVAIAAGLALAGGSPVWAGQVEGTLYREGRPVQGATIELRRGEEVVERIKTSGSGTFGVFLQATGSYELVLPEHGLGSRIYSYPSPVRYDFDLVKKGADGYELRRR